MITSEVVPRKSSDPACRGRSQSRTNCSPRSTCRSGANRRRRLLQYHPGRCRPHCQSDGAVGTGARTRRLAVETSNWSHGRQGHRSTRDHAVVLQRERQTYREVVANFPNIMYWRLPTGRRGPFLTPIPTRLWTVLFKCIVAVSTRNTVTLSDPAPESVAVLPKAVKISVSTGRGTGAPKGVFTCLESPTLPDNAYLMRHKDVAMIDATGGPGAVKAAYSSGKPALGVVVREIRPVYLRKRRT